PDLLLSPVGQPRGPTLFPYTTLFRSSAFVWLFLSYVLQSIGELLILPIGYAMIGKLAPRQYQGVTDGQLDARDGPRVALCRRLLDRKSTRLNSSHLGISYAVFCLKKK